jgi:predicted Zn-dependent peptidase
MMDNHYDEGGIFILFVPKPIIQSIGNAEKKIINQIAILKSGSFSETLFKAAKVSLYKNAVLDMENSSNRLSKIIDAYMTGGDYQSMGNHDKAILEVKRADVIRVANKYFGDNYLSFQSKMGFKSKEQLDKPVMSPLNLISKNSSSKKAIEIRRMNTYNIEPQFVSFENDVKSYNIKTNLHFYYTVNPLNDIFSLNIRIAYGTLTDPMTKQLAYYLNNTGTRKMTYSEFSKQLQLMGSSIYFDANNDYFTISIDGFEKNLDKTISKLNLLLSDFAENKSLNKKMLKDNKIEMKVLKKDLSSKISILEEYALYGNNSSYLKRLTNKELKKIKYDDLKVLLNRILNYESYVHYVGKKKYSEVKEYMAINLPSTLGQIKSQSPIIRPLPVLSHNMLYFLKDNHAIQSHIRYDIPSRAMAQQGRVYIKPFNDYFGIGMNSLIFREVREYRSLAYSAWGYFFVPYKFSAHSRMKIALSTQANKTNQAIDLVDSLILLKKDIEYDISSLRKSVINSINSDIPNFRYKSYIVQYWKMQGYESDPRINYYTRYIKLKAENIDKFYKENIRGRRSIISIVGDSKRFDLEKLKEQREFKELKFKDIIRY